MTGVATIEAGAKAIWDARRAREGGNITWEQANAGKDEFPNTYIVVENTRQEAADCLAAALCEVVDTADKPSPGSTITGKTVRGERSDLPPPPISHVAVTYDHIERLQHAVEGECDGLMIDGGQALAILSYVFHEAPSNPPTDHVVVAEAAEFLCQRLEEFERELNDDEVGRQYYGHVHPAFARLVAALASAEVEGLPPVAVGQMEIDSNVTAADLGVNAEEAPAGCGIADPSTRDCPNMKEVGGGMDGERYSCAVCGKGYYLDYEEMK